MLEKFRAHVESLGYEFFEMSAATTAGTRDLMGRAANLLSELPPIMVYEPDYVAPEPVLGTPENITIEKMEDVWFVEGPWLDRLVSNVNFGDHESVIFFDRMLRDNGIYERMEKLGAQDGDTVSICGMEFEYKD
jgi:GTP-binding protein